MNNPSPEHIKFALIRWATSRGYEVVSVYPKNPKDTHGGSFGVHWLNIATDKEGYHRPVMDYDFCRNLPIDSLEQSYFILEYLANRCGGIISIFNATIEQRLEAYYEAFK